MGYEPEERPADERPEDGLHGYFPPLTSPYGYFQFSQYPVDLLVDNTEDWQYPVGESYRAGRYPQ